LFERLSSEHAGEDGKDRVRVNFREESYAVISATH